MFLLKLPVNSYDVARSIISIFYDGDKDDLIITNKSEFTTKLLLITDVTIYILLIYVCTVYIIQYDMPWSIYDEIQN